MYIHLPTFNQATKGVWAWVWVCICFFGLGFLLTALTDTTGWTAAFMVTYGNNDESPLELSVNSGSSLKSTKCSPPESASRWSDSLAPSAQGSSWSLQLFENSWRVTPIRDLCAKSIAASWVHIQWLSHAAVGGCFSNANPG